MAVIGVFTDVKVQTLLVGLRTRYDIPNLGVSDSFTAAFTLERHLAGLDYAAKVCDVEVVHGVNDLTRFLGLPPPLEEESAVVARMSFARYRSFFQDKQNVLAFQDEKLHQLFVPRGKEHVDADTLPAGDIAAVAKLGATQTGDTLAAKERLVTLPFEPPPEPVLSVAVFPKAKGDEDKLSTALHRIAEEDPSVRVTRNDETRQTLLQGMGEAHLEVTLERIKRKFGVEIVTQTPRIPYRETATRTAEAEGKYKKQTGGHGQFGIAWLRVEPNRAGGFEFVDAIVGGVIPRQFIPAVEKGVHEAMERGYLAGYPLVDLKITVYDGKYHPVDSSEMSFKMAGSLGLQAALEKAGVVLLEPIAELQVIVPDSYSGDVIGDLNSKRGRVMGMEPLAGGNQLIKVQVPLAEVARYSIDLRSLTGGRGVFSMEVASYEEVPANITEKVKAEAARAKEEE